MSQNRSGEGCVTLLIGGGVIAAVVWEPVGEWFAGLHREIDSYPLYLRLGVAAAVVLLIALLVVRTVRGRARLREAEMARWQVEMARRQVEMDRQAERDRLVSLTDDMTGTEFELLVARLLRRDGFRAVAVSGGANDLGADVTAYHPDGRRVVIQCKRYSRPVGSPAVQTFNGAARPHHGADIAALVTTNYFTKAASRFGHVHGLDLVDRDMLAEWMAEGPEMLWGIGPAARQRESAGQPERRERGGGDEYGAPTAYRVPKVSKAPIVEPVYRPADGPLHAPAAEPVLTPTHSPRETPEVQPQLSVADSRFDYFNFVVDPSWVLAGDVEPAIALFESLIDTWTTARLARGRVALYFGGYDDDSREVWEIEEIRRWVRALTRVYPMWAYFLDPESPTLRALMWSLVDVRRVGERVAVNAKQVRDQLGGELGAGVMGMLVAVGDQEMFDQVMAAIESASLK